MKQFPILAPAAASLLCLLLALGCGSPKGEGSQQKTTGVAVVPVETAPVRRQDLAVTKSYTGTFEGVAQANIVAKLSERITGIESAVGQSVKQGQRVILLDKSGTTSQYYQAEASYKNAEKTLERMQTLLAEGAISQQQLDGAQTAFDVAKANFDAARSAVELTSPIAGVVTALNVSLGDLSQPGAVLATVADINRMKVIFSISEADVMHITSGLKVEIDSEGSAGRRVTGEVVQISKSADIRSRSFEIKGLFRNTPDQWYRPGMFGKVSVAITPHQNVLVVPAASVLSDGMVTKVFRVESGRALEQAVTTGISDGAQIEILAGLQENDAVVTTGATNLRDSSYVRIIPAGN